jgi:hypothetical protein
MTDTARLAALHEIVCRVRPDGTQHAFVFDPQGILSDCRYLRQALAATPAPLSTMGHANWCRIGRDHLGPCDDLAATPTPLDERCHCGHLNASCDRPDKEETKQ